MTDDSDNFDTVTRTEIAIELLVAARALINQRVAELDEADPPPPMRCVRNAASSSPSRRACASRIVPASRP